MIKCNQQINYQGKTKKENRFFKKSQHIYRKHGIRGFFRGMCVTTNRDVISYGLYFLIYYTIKDYYKSKTFEFDAKSSALAGMLSGFLIWFVSFPFDTVKTIIQTIPLKENKYPSQLQVFRDLMSHGGFKELFRGASPSLIYSCSFSAFTFIFFDLARNTLNTLII